MYLLKTKLLVKIWCNFFVFTQMDVSEYTQTKKGPNLVNIYQEQKLCLSSIQLLPEFLFDLVLQYLNIQSLAFLQRTGKDFLTRVNKYCILNTIINLSFCDVVAKFENILKENEFILGESWPNHNNVCEICFSGSTDLFCFYCNLVYHSTCLVNQGNIFITNPLSKFVCALCQVEVCAPLKGFCHGIISDTNKLLLFGANFTSNDERNPNIISYDIHTKKWEMLECFGDRPPDHYDDMLAPYEWTGDDRGCICEEVPESADKDNGIFQGPSSGTIVEPNLTPPSTAPMLSSSSAQYSSVTASSGAANRSDCHSSQPSILCSNDNADVKRQRADKTVTKIYHNEYWLFTSHRKKALMLPHLSEAYVLHIEEQTWTMARLGGSAPWRKIEFACCYVPSKQWMFVHGGYRGPGVTGVAGGNSTAPAVVAPSTANKSKCGSYDRYGEGRAEGPRGTAWSARQDHQSRPVQPAHRGIVDEMHVLNTGRRGGEGIRITAEK